MIPVAELLADGVHFSWKHECVVDGFMHGAVAILPHDDGDFTIVTASPLTVTPDIFCTTCGTHGSITNGKWVPILDG